MIDTRIESGVARVALHSPPLNILTRALLAELRAVLSDLSRSRDVRVLLLGSVGPHFSAGASVEEHLAPECDAMIPEFGETVLALYGFPQPVLAAVRGRCLGGGFELVQAADLVLAGSTASFAQPEIRLGVFPPAACVLLPELAPRGVTAELLFTGEPLPAQAAARAGIVLRVVEDDGLDAEAEALAARIARHSRPALALTKKALRNARTSDRSAAVRRSSAVYLDELMKTHDATEGLRAFLDKRHPEWSHQ